MKTPDSRVWDRRQEAVLIQRTEPGSFRKALELAQHDALNQFETNENMMKAMAFLRAEVVRKYATDITEILCIKILRENPLVRKAFNIEYYQDREDGGFDLYDVALIANYLIQLISKRDNL